MNFSQREKGRSRVNHVVSAVPTLRRLPMMNDASKSTGQPAAVNPPGKLAYATPTTAPLVAGRRSFFKYRDLGVTAASSGKIRAQVTIGADGMTRSEEHTSELQSLKHLVC